MIDLRIKQVTIVTGSGSDHVIVDTDLPEAYWPFKPSGMHLRFDAAAGSAEQYVAQHFPGIPVDVVHYSTDANREKDRAPKLLDFTCKGGCGAPVLHQPSVCLECQEAGFKAI